MSRSRSIIIGLPSSMLVGVAITVLIAWHGVLRAPRENYVPAAFGKKPYIAHKMDSDVTWLGCNQWSDGDCTLREWAGTNQDGPVYWTECEAGWPIRALRWTRWRDHEGMRPRHAISIASSSISKWDDGSEVALPISVLWLGMTIGSLLYGAVLLLAWKIIVGIRRTLRSVKKGQCPACGYPLLDSSAICSECGIATVPS